MMHQPNVSVLLVEDNEFDVRRIERAFKKIGATNPLFRAIDGMDAIEQLRSGKIADPLVVLLDLNMPRMNGIEFLDEIRSDATLAATHVHVITTSDYFRDVNDAYQRGINGYYVKPSKGEDMLDVARSLLHLATICQYPDKPVVDP